MLGEGCNGGFSVGDFGVLFFLYQFMRRWFVSGGWFVLFPVSG